MNEQKAYEVCRTCGSIDQQGVTAHAMPNQLYCLQKKEFVGLDHHCEEWFMGTASAIGSWALDGCRNPTPNEAAKRCDNCGFHNPHESPTSNPTTVYCPKMMAFVPVNHRCDLWKPSGGSRVIEMQPVPSVKLRLSIRMLQRQVSDADRRGIRQNVLVNGVTRMSLTNEEAKKHLDKLWSAGYDYITASAEPTKGR